MTLFCQRIGIFIFAILAVTLIFATMIIYKEVEPSINRLCNGNINSTGKRSKRTVQLDAKYKTLNLLLYNSEYCMHEQKTFCVFALFLLTRLASYNFESLILIFCRKCPIRKLISGHRIGIAPGILFLTREILWPHAIHANKVITFGAYATALIASAMMTYPYVQDLCNLCISIKNARNSWNYIGDRKTIAITCTAMFIYALLVSILFSESVSHRFDINIKIYGYNFSFPYVNYPTLIFLLHLLILRTHYRPERTTDCLDDCRKLYKF